MVTLMLLGGGVGGVASLSHWIIGLVLMGGVGGMAFGVHVLNILFSIFSSSSSPIQLTTVRAVIFTALFFMSVFITMLQKKVGIVTSSSLIGAILIGSGVDLFLKSGYNSLLRTMILDRTIKETITWSVFLECIGVTLLATLGMFIQSRMRFGEMEYYGTPVGRPETELIDIVRERGAQRPPWNWPNTETPPYHQQQPALPFYHSSKEEKGRIKEERAPRL